MHRLPSWFDVVQRGWWLSGARVLQLGEQVVESPRGPSSVGHVEDALHPAMARVPRWRDGRGGHRWIDGIHADSRACLGNGRSLGSQQANVPGCDAASRFARESVRASPGRPHAPWFSFIMHLREPGDLDKWQAADALRRHCATDDEWRDQMLSAPPVVAGTLHFRSSPVTGDLMVIPRLPDDIIFGDGRKLVARAVEIAARRGARTVGLGGLTAPATRGGESLLAALPKGVTLTNGNSLTALAARDNVREACAHLRREHLTVAILGSTGSVGVAASRLLADDDISLLLIGRSTQRVRATVPELGERAEFSGDLTDVRRADVVLVLTSEQSAQLTPDHFDDTRPRVVIDIAQPPNIGPAWWPAFRRHKAHVVRGGWVQLPGAVSSQTAENITTEGDRNAPRGCVPACLAETCLFAVEGISKHAVGKGSTKLAFQLEHAAARHGVVVRSLELSAGPEANSRADNVTRTGTLPAHSPQ
jgi:fatty aldehyde-generating acyl-ACP reductase